MKLTKKEYYYEEIKQLENLYKKLISYSKDNSHSADLYKKALEVKNS